MMTGGTTIRAGAPNLAKDLDLRPQGRSATILIQAGAAVVRRNQPVKFGMGVSTSEPL